jgi:hypothetical protein
MAWTGFGRLGRNWDIPHDAGKEKRSVTTDLFSL